VLLPEPDTPNKPHDSPDRTCTVMSTMKRGRVFTM